VLATVPQQKPSHLTPFSYVDSSFASAGLQRWLDAKRRIVVEAVVQLVFFRIFMEAVDTAELLAGALLCPFLIRRAGQDLR
jgi:hypothetical protein